MADEPTPEGKARAKELREEIDRILHPDKKGDRTEGEAAESQPEKAPTPRDFIQKRMRELDGKKDKP